MSKVIRVRSRGLRVLALDSDMVVVLRASSSEPAYIHMSGQESETL